MTIESSDSQRPDSSQHPAADENFIGPQPLFDETTAPVPEKAPTPKQLALKALRERATAEQSEMPFAVVGGEAMTQIPIDLYIPPDALEVFLDAFEGPLDLLLYLIRKQNLDILNINVFEITKQYMEYIGLMHALQFELASEYMVMAAMLAEIKSRMLLPRSGELEEDSEEDPRAELIRRLQEYEQFKEAAESIDTMPRVGREIFVADELRPDYERPKLHPEVDMREIMLAMKEVMGRAEMFEGHEIQKESLSTRARMAEVLDQLQGKAFVPFITLFRPEEGRVGVVVTFLAIMELSKEQLIDLIQNELFAPIHVKARSE
ncbi:segregation and condensation protein A [Reinekea sp.]|jgi:segregation and condensation protein A|uniref:segregation and condensation protein A n=1 Tax=Reinekea sp. TaxID=1970455 RepID=UPI0039895712